MRSPTSTHRRLHGAAPHHGRLDDLARFFDDAWSDAEGPVLLHAGRPERDGIDLGAKPLGPGTHPFPEVAGFVAPPEWDVFGVRALGTAHHLDGGDSLRIAATFLVSRSGEEASLLRTGGELITPKDAAAGTIPDLCRRVLGLPTAPAPSTTSLLWTVAWLDAVLARWSEHPAERHLLSTSFPAVAAQHPVARAGAVVTTVDEVAAAARLHAELWPWSRLRADPGGIALPDGPLPPEVGAWMDDGFFARWCLGAYPHPVDLVRDVIDLLGVDVAAELTTAIEALLPPA